MRYYADHPDMNGSTGGIIWPLMDTSREPKKAIWNDLIKWDNKAHAQGRRTGLAGRHEAAELHSL